MHLVESIAYVGERPWHGLGNRLEPDQPIDVWKRNAGMDWTIEESEVRFITGGNSNGIGTISAFPEQKVLYRSDTKAPLSVVSKRFHVVQPSAILEFYRDLTAVGGFELETAGVLREGRKFWALAKTGQSTLLKGRDRVDGYLLLATACDGTLATTAQFTSVRVVCNNTLAIALGNSHLFRESRISTLRLASERFGDFEQVLWSLRCPALEPRPHRLAPASGLDWGGLSTTRNAILVFQHPRLEHFSGTHAYPAEQERPDPLRRRNSFGARGAFSCHIADLYDPDKMPEDLRRAHERNDEVLERIYIGRRFKNDTERLEKLFDMYTNMTAVKPAAVKKIARKRGQAVS